MSPPPQSTSEPAWSRRDLDADPHAAADKEARVRRMFAAIAPAYDLNNRLHSFGRDQSWRRRAVEKSGVGPADRVLDVACGTGDLALMFAECGAGSVVGVDFTPDMLRIAEHKAERRARHRRNGITEGALAGVVSFEQGDAMNLRFDDAAFDIVSIAFGIRNVADPHAALREFHRVLRPGGRVVVLEFSQPGNRMIRFINDLYCRRILPLTATLIARDRSGAYRYLPRSIETFLEGDAMCNAMRAAGFTDVSSTPLTFGVCTIYTARRGESQGETV